MGLNSSIQPSFSFRGNLVKGLFNEFDMRSIRKKRLSDDLLNEFYSYGYHRANLIDLMVLINLMRFTDNIYYLTKIPLNFPEAKDIYAKNSILKNQNPRSFSGIVYPAIST
jgi:hypothetical protein